MYTTHSEPCNSCSYTSRFPREYSRDVPVFPDVHSRLGESRVKNSSTKKQNSVGVARGVRWPKPRTSVTPHSALWPVHPVTLSISGRLASLY